MHHNVFLKQKGPYYRIKLMLCIRIQALLQDFKYPGEMFLGISYDQCIYPSCQNSL